MCRIFAELDPQLYVSQVRSVRLNGHSTSIRLESLFWIILEHISSEESKSLGKFLSTLHDEVLRFHGEATNFASLLRCACLTYVEQNNDSVLVTRLAMGASEAISERIDGRGAGPCKAPSLRYVG